MRVEFVFPPFRFDPRNERLWRDDRVVALRPKPFALLRYLLERSGELVTKQDLLASAWPDEYVSDSVLKTYLSEIRKALGDSVKAPALVETVHGRGYRFIGAVERRAPVRDATHAPPAPAAHPHMPFEDVGTLVGREHDLERLQIAVEQASAARRQVVFISGEAGIGKTLLAKTFLKNAAQENDTIIACGHCVDQYGAGEPYLPILEALGRWSRGAEGSALGEVLRRYAPTWAALLPSATADADAPGPERTAFPERMLREMAEALEALSAQSTLILWLEDLHWADPSTLDLIAYLAQRPDPARLLLLATYRSLEASESPRLPTLERLLLMRSQAIELSLSYLSVPDVAAYLAARFTRHDFPEALAPLLHRLTSGNPLFMVKLVDAWLERGAIEREAGTWRLRAELGELARGIPGSLVRMIEQEAGRSAHSNAVSWKQRASRAHASIRRRSRPRRAKMSCTSKKSACSGRERGSS